MEILKPTRIFMLGVMKLTDPAPELPAEQAVRLYSANFPIIAQSTLGNPTVQGSDLIYAIEPPPVKTKG